MAGLFVRTTSEERTWEKAHILRQKERYLETDVLRKVKEDDGYRHKVELLENILGPVRGFVLDVGSNTAGECEYLVTRGLDVIATDINEHALSISSERCSRFKRGAPHYVACDGARLPFRDASVSCVVFNESLHHIPEPQDAIKEAHRVLLPGGRIVMFEPYRYDPWRRVAEIRDYFRGTIETSFSERQIEGWLKFAGFESWEIRRPVLPPSQYKLDLLSPARRWLRNTYYDVRRTVPWWLGMLLCVGKKRGALTELVPQDLDSILVCPISRYALTPSDGMFISTAPEPLGYPITSGIPVLIPEDARSVRERVAAA